MDGAQASPPPVVLVVDDDSGIRELFGLPDEGYLAVLAINGREALAAARREPPHGSAV